MALTASLVVVGALMLALAGWAVATDRIPLPWLAGRILRPRLWGVGQVLTSCYVLLIAISQAVRLGAGTDLAVHGVGLVCLFASFPLTWVSQHRLPKGRPSHGQHDLPE